MTTNTLYLREITRTDLPKITAWRQQRDLIDSLGDTFRYVNHESDEAWFNHYLANRQTQVRLAICREDHGHIGNVYLLNIDPITRGAVFHIFISEEHQGQGYGHAATSQALAHGFFDLNLQRISLSVLASNERARSLYKKCGFVEEGIARQAAFKNGHYADVCHLAILREEFKAASAFASRLETLVMEN